MKSTVNRKGMKGKRILAISLATVALGVLSAITVLVPLGCSRPEATTEPEAPTSALVTIYQSKTCDCCAQYVPYLESEGFQVKVIFIEDRTSMWEQYKILPDMRSCHTAIIDGYFVEGHMPSEAIMKLLKERPAIDGIALPGMPAGSPGMPGQKTEAFIIYAITDGVVYELPPY